MQIITEKGKILGTINIIDLILIIFTILVFITGYKYVYLENYPENILDKLALATKPVWINATTFNFLSKTVANAVKEGDVMIGKDILKNETIGKILKIDVEKKAEIMKYRITYALLVNKKPNELIYDGERLILGKDFIFNTNIYSLKGEILKIVQ